MPVHLTFYGRRVLGELRAVGTVALLSSSDNASFNEKLSEAFERQKTEAREQAREFLEQYLQPGQQLEDVFTYTGENGAEQNKTYTGALEKFVGESAVCRAIDLYHWYLRKALQLALDRDRSQINGWAEALSLSPKKCAEIQAASSTNPVLLRLFRGRERNFRDLVHKHLGVPDLEAIPLLVEIRNCIVHHCGEDVDGKAALLVRIGPELGIRVESGQILVNASAAYEAVGRVASDISIIDQALGNVLGLPTTPEALPSFKRVYG